MQVYQPVVDALHAFASNFKYPSFLWGIPIAIALIVGLVLYDFVRFGLDDVGRRKLRRMRLIVILMRSAAVMLVLIALATPFTTISKESEGSPRALVLVDKSASMATYDTGFTDALVRQLSSRLPTAVQTFGTQTLSPVGDAALGHPEHLLLITDGDANTGVDLKDVAEVARQNNLTINAITLTPAHYDAAVLIDAPASVPLGFPAGIRVEVTATDNQPVPVQVTIDGKQAYSAPLIGSLTLDPQLSVGYHRIEARIAAKGGDTGNDVHYSVLQVLDKPKILALASARGPLESALSGLFDTTVAASMPSDLSPYSAIVVDDVSASGIGNSDRIADFLRDEQGGKIGNGLVVVGGFNSFDRGSYQNTRFESLLPVKVGKPKRNLGDNTLVFVIQVSGSTGATRQVMNPQTGKLETVTDTVSVLDIIKAQAASAIGSLDLKNNVGVVAFGVSTTGQSHDTADETIAASVVKIADVAPLYQNKKEVTDRISRIQGGGTTAPDLALRAAVDMLKDKSGSKTIVFLTNGRFSAGLGDIDAGPKSQVESIIANAQRQYGIKTHVIGVGSQDSSDQFAKAVDEQYLVNMAQRSDGLYDRATNMQRLMLEYGDPNEKGFGEDFQLVTLSLTHFITKDVSLDATLNGYNEVAPKDGSRILVKTDSGAPALTVWNYFNGRVAALNVFTASGLGPLLSGNNSDLVRNTVLWAVGDPRRKDPVTVEVGSAIVGHETEVTFTSKDPVSGKCADTPLAFARSSGDSYVFTFTPRQVGFATACGIPYAVNDESEQWRAGVSPDLATAVGISGGQMFTPDQVDAIAERIKTTSTRVTVEKTELRNPFIALAILIFLLEIFIRRLVRQSS